MEIQPPVSLPNCNARNILFTQQKLNDYRRQTVINENNRFETSTDRKVASNIASLTTAYKKDEFIKASASINRPPEYPFQSLNDIYPNNHQFPYFIKPSEYNVNPNTILTIGRVLGADNIDLPEKVLIENLMKLKEYQGVNALLANEAAQNIFKYETEQGANYYTNQIESQRALLEGRAREIRATQKEIPSLTFKKHLPIGNVKLTGEKLKEKAQTYFSPQAQARESFRQQRIREFSQNTYIPPDSAGRRKYYKLINKR